MARVFRGQVCALLVVLAVVSGCSYPPGPAQLPGDPAETSGEPSDTPDDPIPETPQEPLDQSFAVRGVLGSGYQPVGRAARAVDGSVIVDQIIAVPVSSPFIASPTMFDDAATASVAEDGSFEITLGTGRDYMLLLMDSAADRRDQIVGYVALADVVDSMVLIPGSAAIGDVEAGDLSAHGSEAYADGSLVANERSFSYSVDQLREIARTDDVLKVIKNIYINGAAPLFVYWWKVEAASILNAQSQPATYVYDGYQLYLPVPDVGVTFDDVVSKRVTVEIVPPGEVRSVDGLLVRDPSTPFTNDGEFVVSSNQANDDDFSVDVSPLGSIRFGTVGGNIGTILEGWWEIRVNGDTVASFDFAVASPLDASGNPLVYLPGLEAVVDEATGVVDRFETAWYRYDAASGQYLRLEDFTIMLRAVDWAGFGWDTEAMTGARADFADVTTSTAVPASTLYFYGTEGQAPDEVLRSILYGYRMYGVDFSLSIRADQG